MVGVQTGRLSVSACRQHGGRLVWTRTVLLGKLMGANLQQGDTGNLHAPQSPNHETCARFQSTMRCGCPWKGVKPAKGSGRPLLTSDRLRSPGSVVAADMDCSSWPMRPTRPPRREPRFSRSSVETMAIEAASCDLNIFQLRRAHKNSNITAAHMARFPRTVCQLQRLRCSKTGCP